MSKYIKQEDAIYVDCILMDQIECKDCSLYDEERNVCRMVEWLESIPTIEVSEDCISREQFREQMYHRCFEVDNDPNMQKWDSGNWLRWKLFEEELENAPSVIPTTEQSSMVGEWENYKDEHRCSECGEVVIGDWYDDEWYDYCPNCGAKMK